MPLTKRVLPVCHVSPVVSDSVPQQPQRKHGIRFVWFVRTGSSDASLSQHLSFSICEVWVTTCIAKPCFVMASNYLLSPWRRFMFCLWWYLLAVFLTFCCLTMISDPGLGLLPAFVSYPCLASWCSEVWRLYHIEVCPPNVWAVSVLLRMYG